jgi:sterol desaturase/sphingolipid hydroxylase (fatty acid hydroxylase superfamily)
MKFLSAWIAQFLLGDNFVLMALMFALVGVAEFVRPARKAPIRHYRFNIAYALVTTLLAALLAPPVNAAIAFAVQTLPGTGLIDLTALGFGGVRGAVAAMLLSAVIFDFFFYWFHRLEHASPVFWQQHLLHHSDEYMTVTTAGRGHFLEIFLIPTFVTLPMAILFKLPPVTIGVLSLVPFAWLYFVHANIRLGFGPLWWLLVSPDYHRIHHSLEPQHLDQNLANWFPVWDILFGTAWRPRPGENPATGVAGVTVASIVEAYLLPFVGWTRMIQAQLGHAPGPPQPLARPARTPARKRLKRR